MKGFKRMNAIVFRTYVKGNMLPGNIRDGPWNTDHLFKSRKIAGKCAVVIILRFKSDHGPTLFGKWPRKMAMMGTNVDQNRLAVSKIELC